MKNLSIVILLISAISVYAEENKNSNLKQINLRTTSCIKAFSHQTFCHCIDKKMHKEVKFDDYIFVITKSKAAVGYDMLDSDWQKRIDSVYAARKQCELNN